MNYAGINCTRLLIFAALVLVAGCGKQAKEFSAESEAFVSVAGLRCAPNCQLNPGLPADTTKPPTLPRNQTTLAIEGGTKVTIPGPPATAGIVGLLFQHPALSASEDESGALTYIELIPGQDNVFWALSAGSCPAAGCKYTIFDKSNPRRPPLDPWIILF
jgi:hypothetical protein